MSQDIADRFSLEGETPWLAILPDRPAGPIAQEVRSLVQACAAPVDVLILVHGRVPAPESPGEEALLEAIEHHCWPLVEAVKQVRAASGAYPRHVLVLSTASAGGALAAESALAVDTVLVPYLNHRFASENVIFNTLRVEPREERNESVAKMVFALTSGFLDAIRGQVLHVNPAACGFTHE